MTTKNFVKELEGLAFENTFNPYSDFCQIHDMKDAPRLRSKTLQSLISAAEKVELDAIWIGRDLGYRGGRRTGLALTDDAHIEAYSERWNLPIPRPTKGQIVAERTASVIWGILNQITANVFLWNVFPLHPHGTCDPFSNRNHNSKEREAGEELLGELIKLLKPRYIVAIGNDAAKSAMKFDNQAQFVKVRHPSYGGQTQFISEMQDFYNLRPVENQLQLL